MNGGSGMQFLRSFTVYLSLVGAALSISTTAYAQEAVSDEAKQAQRQLWELTEKAEAKGLSSAAHMPYAYAVAIMYLTNQFVHDPDAGIRWLEKAHDMGHDDALYLAAQFRMSGEHGVTLNGYQAKKHLETIAQGGHPYARHDLGMFYLEGKKVGDKQAFEKDTEKALYYLREAAQQWGALPSANTKLAEIYLEGELVERDVPEAIAQYEAAIGNGAFENAAILQKLYETDPEVKAEIDRTNRDLNKVEWVSNPYYKDIYTYGLRYLIGLGTAQNNSRAFEIWQTQAELNRDTIPILYIWARLTLESQPMSDWPGAFEKLQKVNELVDDGYSHRAYHAAGRLLAQKYMQKWKEAHPNQ